MVLNAKNMKELEKLAEEKLGTSIENININIIETKKKFFRTVNIKASIELKDDIKVSEDKEVESSSKEIQNSYKEEDESKGDSKFEIIEEDGDIYLKVDSEITITTNKDDIIKYIEYRKIEDFDQNLLKASNLDIDNKIKIAEEQTLKPIKASIEVFMSNDKLSGYIVLYKPFNSPKLSKEEILDKLKAKNIKFGIKEDLIDKLEKEPIYDEEILIAEGKSPIEGKKSEKIYHVEIGIDKNPSIKETGEVDFKNISIIKNVKKGQLLLEVTMPEEGETGRTITDIEIPVKQLKPLLLNGGRNTIKSEDGLKLYSAIDGAVSELDKKISVEEIYEVPANVDNTTGNINFNGSVVVKGNINTGFVVKASGNIEVNGVVEGASLVSGGDIILKKGVQGNNKSDIIAKGNLLAKFIENANIKVEGCINSSTIIHSNISALGIISVLDSKGLITGGTLRSLEGIKAKVIGSEMGSETSLEVGINPEDKERVEVLSPEIKKLKAELEDLNKSLDIYKEMSEKIKLPKDKAEKFKKILLETQSKKQILDEKEGELNKINDKIENYANHGYVEFTSKIYEGVRIKIRNSIKFINKSESRGRYILEDGDIVLKS